MHARMNVGKPVWKNEEYIGLRKVMFALGLFEVNAVFNGEPVELLEENT